VRANYFEELSKLGETMVELQFAALRRLAGLDGDQELQQTTWKAYDAAVRFANVATDELYVSPVFGAAVGRTMDTALKWQRLNSAVAGAFFAALWPAVGLPTAAELTELRSEVGALRDELTSARLEAFEARAALSQTRPEEQPADESMAAIWHGWIPLAPPFAPRGVRKDGRAN
jgi:hypothetical protein